MGASPSPPAISDITQNPGRASCLRCTVLKSKNIPTEASIARNEYFAMTPTAPIAPAATHARRSSRWIAR